MNKPSVAVLALGGTIAMTRGDGAGVVPNLTGEKLVGAVPELQEIAHIDARSFRQLPGAHLQFADLEALADTIRELASSGCQGVVITQGTDTIEETAFVLDRLVDLPMPLIVTGAMRNPTLPGADGPGNILAAVRVAVSAAARGCGCMVVLNDEIHAARFVRKMHSSRPDAFGSPNCGRIGWISEDKVILGLRPPHVEPLVQQPTPADARVGLVKIALGDDGTMVRALTAARLDGLVVEATGGGHVAPSVADALEQAAHDMPVILVSRTGAGDTLAKTYGFLGSEIDLQRRGLIRGGWLDGLKARLLLTLLLRHGVTHRDRIVQAFRPWGGD
ncbi:asparaginase [Castellaniella sp.]|uniref:asparaginase n=1 Tax=Castellaniella sp. TaxID=1955812 RepID=UPI0035666996